MRALLAAEGGGKEVIGFCNDTLEISWLVTEETFISRILTTGYIDDQNTVLKLGLCDARDKRPATLWDVVFTPAETYLRYNSDLGRMVGVKGHVPPVGEPYTLDPATGIYFRCVK